MKFTKSTVAFALVLGSALGCGAENKSAAGKQTGKVDTSTYKNTADSATLESKGQEAKKIFAATDEKLDSVGGTKSTLRSLGLLQRQALLSSYDEAKCNDGKVETSSTTIGDTTVTTSTCTYDDDSGASVTCTVVVTKSVGSNRTKVMCDNGTNIETSSSDAEEASTTTTSTTTGSVSPEFDYSAIEDFESSGKTCADAIANIKEFYGATKSQLDTVLAGLSDKDAFVKEAGKSFGGGIKVEEATDSNAAIAYKFTSDPATKGLVVNGSITAGASDDLIVVNYALDVVADFSEMFKNIPSDDGTNIKKFASFEAGDGMYLVAADDTRNDDAKSMKVAMSTKHRLEVDLGKQIIDYEDSGTGDFNGTAFSWESLNTIEGGDKPSITVSMAMSGKDPETDKDVSTKVTMSVNVVDENTVQVTGTGVIDGKSQVYSRTIAKDKDGACTVVDESSK